MTTFVGRLKEMLFVKHQYKEKIAELKKKRVVLDSKIATLEKKATVNGDEEWFLRYVRKDPSCALKVLRECDKNGDA